MSEGENMREGLHFMTFAEHEEGAAYEQERRVKALSFNARKITTEEKMRYAERQLLEARAQFVKEGGVLLLQDVRNVMGDALRIAETKNTAYGDAWRRRGYMANLARVFSKVDRLENLMWQDAEGPAAQLPENNGEPLEETALDLLNLVAFMVVNMRASNRWGEGSDIPDMR